MVYDFCDGSLIFVACHRHCHSVRHKCGEEFRNAGIWTREVGAVIVVIRAEFSKQPVDGDRVCVRLCALHEFTHAVAYHIIVCREWMRGEPHLFEGMIAGVLSEMVLSNVPSRSKITNFFMLCNIR